MADDLEVKTKFCINKVKVPIYCRIQTTPAKKDKELVFLSSGDKFVYLFESSRILNIFSFPGCVRYFMVDGQFVLAITEDGKIWRVPFSRHKAKTSSKPSSSALPTNQGIFSDLLSSNNKEQPNTENKSSVHVTEVTTNNAILCEPNVSVVLPYKDFLITMATSEQESTVSFYGKCSDLAYNSVPIHREFLKSEGGAFSFPACLLVLCDNGSFGDNILQSSTFDGIKPKESQGDSVLLYGCQEGHVWSLNSSPNIVKNAPELVWHLEETVCYLSLTMLNTDDSSDKSIDKVNNAIIAVGRRGKCVIIFHHGGECTYSEHNLSGPILCCLSYSNSIFYSNGKEVCMAKVSLVKDGESSNAVLVTTYFAIANVAAMCPLKLSSSPLDRCHLKMLTLTGKVLEASLNFDETKTVSCSQSKQGNYLKDLLFSIEDIAVQTKSLQKDLDIVEKTLKQLNQDISLLFKVNSCLKPSECLKWTVSPSYVQRTDAYHLTVKLQNLTRILIHENWSILIQIKGIPSEDLSSRKVISHSMNIGNLAYGNTKEFFLPLPCNYNLTTCLTVEAYICYNLKTLLGKLPKGTQQATDCILVSLGLIHIDILHFMTCHCRVEDNGFSISARRSRLDELESFCQTTSDSCSNDVSVTESSLKTIRLPIAKEIFTSITKPAKPPFTLRNHDLQVLYNMMSNADDILEVNGEEGVTSQMRNDLDDHALKIRLETPKDKGVIIVLEAPSALELYALVEAFASRLMALISHCCTTDKIDDAQLKETLQYLEELKSQLVQKTCL